MHPLRRAPLALTLALAAVSAGAVAAEAVDSPDSIETVIVSATRLPETLGTLAGSVSAVSSDELALIAHTHINEALARVPGAWVNRGNGQESLISIRSPVFTGPGSCGAFYLAEDGIPLRAPGFCNVNELFDVNAEQAERIEVIRGPGTAVHGSNALNGVINVVSMAPAPARQTLLSLEGGPHNYGRLKASYSDGSGRHRFRLSANGTHDGGYKDESGFDQQKFSGRHDVEGESWTVRSLLTGANLNQETAGFVLGEDAYQVDSRKTENPNPEAFRDANSARWYSRFEKTGTNNTLLVITPYARYTDMEFLQHFLPGTPLEENGERSVGVQTAFYKPVSEQARIYHGVDVEMTDAYLREAQSDPSFGAFPTGQHYDYQVDALNLGWFIGGDHTFGGGTRLNGGVRYELQSYDYDNQMLDGFTAADGSVCSTANSTCRYARPSDREDQYNNWSLFGGLIQPLGDHFNFTTQLTHGFRAPQAAELYRRQVDQKLTSSLQFATKLDSEEISSAELGLRGHWSHFSFAAVGYFMRKDSVIIQDSQRRNLSDGETLHRGVELNLDWQLLDNLRLALQGSYARHQYSNDALNASVGADIKGNDVDTAPRRLASAQLQWQPLAGSTVELEWQYVGRYYLEEKNERLYHGHYLWHLRWQQQLTERVHAAVRVTNLTDEDYAERADFAFGNYRYFIGEPRAVYGEIGLKL